MGRNYTVCYGRMTSLVRLKITGVSRLLVLMPLVVHVANLVLEETIERIYSKNHYADKYVGLYLIRGENVVLLGEIVRLSCLSPYLY